MCLALAVIAFACSLSCPAGRHYATAAAAQHAGKRGLSMAQRSTSPERHTQALSNYHSAHERQKVTASMAESGSAASWLQGGCVCHLEAACSMAAKESSVADSCNSSKAAQVLSIGTCGCKAISTNTTFGALYRDNLCSSTVVHNVTSLSSPVVTE